MSEIWNIFAGFASLACVAGIAIFYTIHRYVIDKLRYNLPPGPVPIPLMGTAYLVANPHKKPWVVYNLLSKLYGPLFTFYLGQYRVIHLNGATVIRKALVTHSKIFNDRPYDFMSGWGNDYRPFGLVASSGEKWARLRRFSKNMIDGTAAKKPQMISKIHDEVGFLIEEIEKRSVNGVVMPYYLFFNAIANMACGVIFNHRYHYDDNEFLDLLHTMQDLFERPFSQNAFNFSFPFTAKFKPPPFTTGILRIVDKLRPMINAAIQEHEKDFDAENIRDFIDLYILELKNPNSSIDFDSFLGSMEDMFIAGTETTTSSLIFVILYSCKYPELQKRCQDEIDQVIDTDRLPTLEDRPRLVYIEAFICEVLRHVAVLPTGLMHGVVREPATFEGYDIPAQTIVTYNIYGVLHDVDYWKDPEEFRPERWIDENGALLSHSSHFFAFGLGPRACLGEQMARIELFLFFVTLAHRLNFSLPEGEVLDLEKGHPMLTHVPPKVNLLITRR